MLQFFGLNLVNFQSPQEFFTAELLQLGYWGATEQKSGIGKCSESNNLSFNYLQASITYTD